MSIVSFILKYILVYKVKFKKKYPNEDIITGKLIIIDGKILKSY